MSKIKICGSFLRYKNYLRGIVFTEVKDNIEIKIYIRGTGNNKTAKSILSEEYLEANCDLIPGLLYKIYPDDKDKELVLYNIRTLSLRIKTINKLIKMFERLRSKLNKDLEAMKNKLRNQFNG